MQKITPFLWFNDKAEEAMNFYTSIFKNSKTGSITRYGEAGPGPKGTVMYATFQLDGQEFFALNGGPQFTFLAGHIDVRELRDTGGGRRVLGEALRGRRKAKMRLAERQVRIVWQIVPSALGQMLSDKDAKKSQRVMKAMMQMDKLDIKG